MSEPSHYQQSIFGAITARWGQLKLARRGRGPWPRNLIAQAGPGSGKSWTTREACSRIRDAKIEVVSFSNRVAADAAPRLPSNATSVTLHAVGKRALQGMFGRTYRERSQMQDGDGELAKDKTRRIVARLKEQGKIDQYVPVGMIAKLVGAAKGVGLVPRDAHVGIKTPLPLAPVLDDEGRDDAWRALMEHHSIDYREPGRLIGAARTALRMSLESSTAIIDFDDMPYVAAVLRDIDFAYSTGGGARDVVMVDELQDLDPVQRRLVRRMIGLNSTAHTALFFGVGDPRQAIFAWRGATQDGMKVCAEEFDCDVLPLPICYRCPTLHIDRANAECDPADGALIEARPDAPLGEIVDLRTGQVAGTGPLAQTVARRALELDGEDVGSDCDRLTPDLFAPGDAVICRTNAPLVSMAYWLMRSRVPCRLIGRDFGRGLATMAEGVGGADADDMLHRLSAKLRKLEERDARDKTLDGEPSEAQARLRDSLDVLAAVVDSLMTRQAPLDPVDDAEDARTAPKFAPITVGAVVREVESLFGDQAGDGSDCVTLLSIHRAKGGEWDRVWWLDEGANKARPVRPGLPVQSWVAREARNLRFVAMTRARQSLYFISSDML